MPTFAKRSIVLAALLLNANAALRPRALAATPTTGANCPLLVSQSGTASIEVDPDQLVMTVSVKSPVASEAGLAAQKVKAQVEAVDGAKYAQTFRQDTRWDSDTRKNVKGDWSATGTVTLPIEAGEWGAADGGGSKAVSALINKLLALTSTSSAPTLAQQPSQYGGNQGYRRRLQAYGEDDDEGKGEEDKGAGNDNWSYASEEGDGPGYGYGERQQTYGDSYGYIPSDAAPIQQQHGDAGVKVSIESMHFAVSDQVAKSTQKRALSLAVADAIARIGEAAAPFRSVSTPGYGKAGEGVDAQNLSQVRVTNGSGGSYPQARSVPVAMSFDQAEAGSAGGGVVVEAADLTYAVPQKQPVSQTVSVSACVSL